MGRDLLSQPKPVHESGGARFTRFWYPKPELMFTGNYLNCDYTSWDIMPDQQHFIMIQSTHPDPPKTELHLIQNWFEELNAGCLSSSPTACAGG